MDKQAITALVKGYGLEVESRFVPWSLSRNAGDKSPSLNWIITLKQNGNIILSTDYMAGCGHCPSYKKWGDSTVYGAEMVKQECEKGKSRATPYPAPIKPDSLDVIHSLLMDSEVIEYDDFTEWARDMGYNDDSRQDEAIYKACMVIALKFKKLGMPVIDALRDAFKDY